MIILDTNVLSALMLSSPDESVIKWLDRCPPESVWTTSITLLEVQLGLQLLVASRRRKRFEQAFERAVVEDFGGRILSFDEPAALAAAALAARRQRQGRPVEFRDTQIAGIATARRATLATRNTKHFRDLEIDVVDPWAGSR
ncbi:MAG TPA: type II toxin-antitoxin system VapC family toxin [Vicinamibacteria bacterium]|nr:type II toxin-antitoxin system VapC family toxin [Vicinamibacteria bacterium]